MELNVHLRATDGAPLSDSTRYRHLVVSLIYLAVIRPLVQISPSCPTTISVSILNSWCNIYDSLIL
jgi:hypothetical protein